MVALINPERGRRKLQRRSTLGEFLAGEDAAEGQQAFERLQAAFAEPLFAAHERAGGRAQPSQRCDCDGAGCGCHNDKGGSTGHRPRRNLQPASSRDRPRALLGKAGEVSQTPIRNYELQNAEPVLLWAARTSSNDSEPSPSRARDGGSYAALSRRCIQIRDMCIRRCTDMTLPTYTFNGDPFYKCKRECMDESGC
jgi:hypothetical protein